MSETIDGGQVPLAPGVSTERTPSEVRQRTTVVSVRCTPEEAAFIRWAAEAREMTVGAFLRECALEKAAQPVVRWTSHPLIRTA